MKKIIKTIIRNSLFSYYRNVFRRKQGERALVSYLTAHRYCNVNYTHTVFIEVDKICQAFNNCGFVVDLIDYRYNWRVDYSKYDVVCGWGMPFSKALNPEVTAKKIYYLNNAMNLTEEVNRIKYLKERKGRAVQPRRHYYDVNIYKCLALSECVVSLGTKWTTNTILPYNNNVYRVPAPVYTDQIPYIKPSSKKFDEARKNFLWFGSLGAVHKGLDILLDIFSKNPQLYLHVCGNVTKEEDFIQIYRESLFNKPNIKYHGFLPISSAEFKDIVMRCMFVVHPSCSEGAGASVLTCMSAGLIPITTLNASVEVKDFGFLIEDVRVDKLEKLLIGIVLSMNPSAFTHKANAASTYARQMHSPESFMAAFEKVINKVT